MTTPTDLDEIFAASVEHAGGPDAYFERVVAPLLDTVLDAQRPFFGDPARLEEAFFSAVEIPLFASRALDSDAAHELFARAAVAHFWRTYFSEREARGCMADWKIGLSSVTTAIRIAMGNGLINRGLDRQIALDCVLKAPLFAVEERVRKMQVKALEKKRLSRGLGSAHPPTVIAEPADALGQTLAKEGAAALERMRSACWRDSWTLPREIALAWAAVVQATLSTPTPHLARLGCALAGPALSELDVAAAQPLAARSPQSQRWLLWMAQAGAALADPDSDQRKLKALDLGSMLLDLRAEHASDAVFLDAAAFAARDCAIACDAWLLAAKRPSGLHQKRAKDWALGFCSLQGLFMANLADARAERRPFLVAASGKIVAEPRMDQAAALMHRVLLVQLGGAKSSAHPNGQLADSGAQKRPPHYAKPGPIEGAPGVLSISVREREIRQAFRDAWLANRTRQQEHAKATASDALLFPPETAEALAEAFERLERHKWSLPSAAHPATALAFLSELRAEAAAWAERSGKNIQELLAPLSATLARALILAMGARGLEEAIEPREPLASAGREHVGGSADIEDLPSALAETLCETAWPIQLRSAAQKEELARLARDLPDVLRNRVAPWIEARALHASSSVSLMADALAFVAAAARFGADEKTTRIWSKNCEMAVAQAERAQLRLMVADIACDRSGQSASDPNSLAQTARKRRRL